MPGVHASCTLFAVYRQQIAEHDHEMTSEHWFQDLAAYCFVTQHRLQNVMGNPDSQSVHLVAVATERFFLSLNALKRCSYGAVGRLFILCFMKKSHIFFDENSFAQSWTKKCWTTATDAIFGAYMNRICSVDQCKRFCKSCKKQMTQRDKIFRLLIESADP